MQNARINTEIGAGEMVAIEYRDTAFGDELEAVGELFSRDAEMLKITEAHPDPETVREVRVTLADDSVWSRDVTEDGNATEWMEAGVAQCVRRAGGR